MVLRKCANRRHANQYGLVLAAVGIESAIVNEGRQAILFVNDRDSIRANQELMAYDAENRTKKRRVLKTALPRLEVALFYWVVLLFFFAAASNNALSLHWLENGSARAEAIINGEWWRVITALFLHVSVAHLLANLVFGAVFLLLLVQITGAGVAALSVIVSGAVGNTINALWHSTAHSSIGASTAIFASLGILVLLGLKYRGDGQPSFSLRYWAPLFGGLTLLVILGFGGDNTDISAHVFGFFAGIAAGWVLAKWNIDWLSRQPLQWKCGGVASAIVVIAWFTALFA